MNWRLWLAQIGAVTRLELSRNFGARRLIVVFLLALSPVLLFGVHAIARAWGMARCSGGEDLAIFAAVFQVFVLRLAVFFGCVAIFMNLFRGEVLEKSLHYYFLAPVRREVLVAGKYVSGVVTSTLLFGLGMLFAYLIVCAHIASIKHQDLFTASMLGQLSGYVGVTALACAGYGAVFLAMGLLFRNPMVPVVAVLLWESITVFLPPLLKKLSLIFYLESLLPLRVPPNRGGISGLFAITADPTPPWIAIPGLLCLTVAVLALASLAVRRMEVNYGTE